MNNMFDGMFVLGAAVRAVASNEEGVVVGRVRNIKGEPEYSVRLVRDGKQERVWMNHEDIEPQHPDFNPVGALSTWKSNQHSAALLGGQQGQPVAVAEYSNGQVQVMIRIIDNFRPVRTWYDSSDFERIEFEVFPVVPVSEVQAGVKVEEQSTEPKNDGVDASPLPESGGVSANNENTDPAGEEETK